jgi:hypothetical protein
MENKQTAVDFFMNSLNAKSYSNDFWKAYKQAKEMEKEQIIDAYDYAYTEGWHMEEHKSEQYYNETYGQ